jgi:hypothetical protein
MKKIVTANEDVDADPNVPHAKTNPKPRESGLNGMKLASLTTSTEK